MLKSVTDEEISLSVTDFSKVPFSNFQPDNSVLLW